MERDQQSRSMMEQFAREMRTRFGPVRWHAVVGKSDEEQQMALISWQAEFRRRGMTWKNVMETLHSCSSENCEWPTMVDFFGVWEDLNASAMGHASFRPANEVLAQHQGTERAALTAPMDSAAKARNRAKGRATFDALKASF